MKPRLLSAAQVSGVQTVVLRSAPAQAVAHLVLRVPPGQGRAAARLLQSLRVTFGVDHEAPERISVGLSFDGLRALGLPDGYQTLFRQRARAFADGAERREAERGEGAVQAAQRLRWPELSSGQSHVLVSWHGRPDYVLSSADELGKRWHRTFNEPVPEARIGRRLGAPAGQLGEWVHFGYRDGISEVCIDDAPRREIPDPRPHAPGALLLGHADDAGANRFALSRAPDDVRAFFRDSSFGVLHPMLQRVSAFAARVREWSELLPAAVPAHWRTDFVRAKLCGRWPIGRVLRPGDVEPTGGWTFDTHDDPRGEGCPFAAHVRRMRATEEAAAVGLVRPLQRRSVPFGPAAWDGDDEDGVPRGLIGHFFAADLEAQFEHLLGAWAARPTLGLSPDDRALDPLIGPHGHHPDPVRVPLRGEQPLDLTGPQAWTLPLGTMYAWYPSRTGWAVLMDGVFVPDDEEGPWR